MTTYCLCAALCVLLAKTTPAINVNVECKWEKYRKQLSRLFSLDLLINTHKLISLTSKQITILDRSGIVTGHFGNITDQVGILRARLDIKCGDAQHIRCEAFGMLQQTSYRNLTITPQLEFNVATRSISIAQTPLKETYRVGDVVLLTCSAQFGVNKTRLQWIISHSNTTSTDHTDFHPIPVGGLQASTVTLSDCSYHVESKYVIVPAQQGEITLKCIAENETRSTHLTIGSHKDNFSTHLLLSSMLVYMHFIILPCVFALCGKRLTYREPERLYMRTSRTAISFLVGLAFFIWWLIVLGGHVLESLSYFMFAVIEFIFLMGYTVTRFSANLSRCFEKKRQRYLHNLRVATSYGATMTPGICWIMIKCYGGTSIIGLEVFFWMVTILSFFGFVFVSTSREGKYWEISEKDYI